MGFPSIREPGGAYRPVVSAFLLLAFAGCASDQSPNVELQQRLEQLILYHHLACGSVTEQRPGAVQPSLRLRQAGPDQAMRAYCANEIDPQMAEIAERALREAGRRRQGSPEQIMLLSLAAEAGLGGNGRALAAGQRAAELGEQACSEAEGREGRSLPADLSDECTKLKFVGSIQAHDRWMARLAPVVRTRQQSNAPLRDPNSRGVAADAARNYFPEVAEPAIAAYRKASNDPTLSPQVTNFAKDWLQQMRCATMVIQALNINEPKLRDEVGGAVKQFPTELRQVPCGPAL